MQAYLDVVREVLEIGTRKPNRTGIDTLSTFNINYEIPLTDGFPLLTTKKISWKNIVVENLWFLSGATDIALLKKHGCKFWDPWADEQGKVPSAYGNFWRHFPVHGDGQSSAEKQRNSGECGEGGVGATRDFNDQIRFVLNELQRNPMSRRLVISAWAPGNAQVSALPPCHCLYILNVQNSEDGDPSKRTLNLHLTQRSCDVALGLPYNIAGYAFLLHLFAQFSGLQPGIFSHTLVDAHIYTDKQDSSQPEHDHVPGLQQQLTRPPRVLPSLAISPDLRSIDDVMDLLALDTPTLMTYFEMKNYNPAPAIAFKVAV